MKKTVLILTTITCVSLIISCTKDVSPEPDISATPTPSSCDTVTFTQDIKPIISANCAISGCHVSGGQSPDLTVDNNIKTQADGGRIKARVIDGPAYMPAAGRLPDAQINIIQCWLDAGAPLN